MITSLSEEVGRTTRRSQARDLEGAYQQLNDFVDKINDKILSRLQLFQQVYLDDYKEQVGLMSEELKQLRANFDSQVLQQKSNEKMYLLEEERDFFRAQVLKLNQEVNSILEDNKTLRNQIVDLQNEVHNYKTITFNFQKKIQKLQLEKTQINNAKKPESPQSLSNMPKEESQNVKAVVRKQTLEPKLEASHSRTSFLEKKGGMTVRARTYSKIESATKASIRKYEEANERDHIIDECLKEVKRQIFYRNSEHKNETLPFDQISKINFDKFTRTDKKSMVLKLLNNEKIVQEFGDFLTGKNSGTALSRMVKTKVGDDKFNDKFLSELKRSFSRKILELKGQPSVRGRRELQTQ